MHCSKTCLHTNTHYSARKKQIQILYVSDPTTCYETLFTDPGGIIMVHENTFVIKKQTIICNKKKERHGIYNELKAHTFDYEMDTANSTGATRMDSLRELQTI